MFAVAALSARLLAELARASGERVIALDVFGDADTRAAAADWRLIGKGLRIDAEALLAALRALALDGSVQGWIAGSGFEAGGDLLEQAAGCLPLIGTAPEDVARLRDARAFFATLDELGLVHPPVRFTAPTDPNGWLVKHPASAGGLGVWRAGDPGARQGAYWQVERAGRAMSATIVANGREAMVLGLNEQITQAIHSRPHVFAGVVGPVAVSARLRDCLRLAAGALAGRYRLRGLASLDFMLVDGKPEWLEVNARPPTSAALYAAADPWRMHLRACLNGELPDAPPASRTVHGHSIVFADRAQRLRPEQADLIARLPGAHDLPLPGTTVQPGMPLCSLSAQGDSAAVVHAALASQHRELLQALHDPVQATA